MFLLFLSFMLGLSLLLPWNSLLKSLPYMMTRIPVEWRNTAPLWYTLTFTQINCLTLIGLTFTDLDTRLIRRLLSGAGRIRGGEKSNGNDTDTETIVSMRLYCGLIGCGLLLLLACAVPLKDLLRRDQAGSTANLILFWVIFVCTGLLMSLLQRSVYPLMSLLPGRKESLISAMLTGQAIAGISASMGSFLFASKSNSDSDQIGGGARMALIYFTCSVGALVLTAAASYKYHHRSRTTQEEVEKGKQSSKSASNTSVFSIKLVRETLKLISPWPQLLALNFAITISIFPGLLTSSARSLSSTSPHRNYFVPLTFLTFDLFDLIGKVMPSIWHRGLSYKSKLAKLFPVARIVFIPIILCLPNFSLLTAETSIKTDVFYFLVLGLMAWSSGWGNAICLINGPSKANEEASDGTVSDDLNDKIGGLMGLSITIGLVGGSLASFILKKTLFN